MLLQHVVRHIWREVPHKHGVVCSRDTGGAFSASAHGGLPEGMERHSIVEAEGQAQGQAHAQTRLGIKQRCNRQSPIEGAGQPASCWKQEHMAPQPTRDANSSTAKLLSRLSRAHSQQSPLAAARHHSHTHRT